ncbi:hypothetical protein M8998_07005 [Sphingobacterium sp. lm-10]|uniref:hypothetical protein n=1 Tax=Sphingobacterium sp. lm-10 TaxID=2944904 RepID=UPI00201FDE57|nr:hypothetical protein [Sphingobacterium sp. lm-10]MCL7987682.1 hypothetical protein [Sphingobacterium sp. lm-10]
MNKQLLTLCVGLCLALSSCQKESVSEPTDKSEITIDGKSYQINHLKGLAVTWFQRDISEIGYDEESRAFYIHGYENKWNIEEILPTLLHFEQK